jgi:hypothetical protein
MIKRTNLFDGIIEATKLDGDYYRFLRQRLISLASDAKSDDLRKSLVNIEMLRRLLPVDFSTLQKEKTS